jgi:ABC-type Zn uptake system ZnuABC Zn-binding protein ZnuA
MARHNGDVPHGIDGHDWMALVGVLAGLTVLMMGVTHPAAQPSRPKVLTTVAPLTNIVQNVGGPYIDLHGLIPGGTDSHTFEPAPSDIRYISEADVIILNGLDLEVPTEKLALANKKPGARILKLGDQTISPQEYVFDRSFPPLDTLIRTFG